MVSVRLHFHERKCAVRWCAIVCWGSTFLLGLILMWSALYKTISPIEAERLVSALLSSTSATIHVRVVIVIELLLAVALLAGIRPRLSLAIFILLVSLFSAALFHARSIGFEGRCGCLGLSSTVRDAIIRNASLVTFAMIGYFASVFGVKSDYFAGRSTV